MRRALLLASTAVLALSAPALAADLGRGVAPTVISAPMVQNWAGLYVGGHLGYGFSGRFDTNLAVFGPGLNSRYITGAQGLFGGLQAGYDWQFGSVIVGGAVDISLSGIRNTVPAIAAGTTARGQLDWFGSARLRAGVLAGNDLLIYATGGLGFGQAKATVIPAGLTQSRSHLAWTVGMGAEYRVSSAMTAFTEYRYTDYRPERYAVIGTNIGFEGHTVRLGLNWRFSTGENVIRAAY